jgi:hypothetical protein
VTHTSSRLPLQRPGRISAIRGCNGEFSFAIVMQSPRCDPEANKCRQIADNMAKMPSWELSILAAEHLGVRVLYSVLYMTARSEAVSYLRSGVYAWSVGIPFYGLWKAANLLM